MFGFLKRKKTYPAYVELPIPEGCREMTEYEKRFVVNGGGPAMSSQHQAEIAEAYKNGDQQKVDEIMSHYQNNGSGTTSTTPAASGTANTTPPTTSNTAPATIAPQAIVPPTTPANTTGTNNKTTSLSNHGGSGASGENNNTGANSSNSTPTSTDYQTKEHPYYIDYKNKTVNASINNNQSIRNAFSAYYILGDKGYTFRLTDGSNVVHTFTGVEASRKYVQSLKLTIPNQESNRMRAENLKATDGKYYNNIENLNTPVSDMETRHAKAVRDSIKNMKFDERMIKSTRVVVFRPTDGLGNSFNGDRYIYKSNGVREFIVYRDRVGANCKPEYNEKSGCFTEPDGIYHYTTEGLTKQEDGTYDSKSYKNTLRHITFDDEIDKKIRDKINFDPADFLDHGNQRIIDTTGPYNDNLEPGSAGCTICQGGQAQQDEFMRYLYMGVNNITNDVVKQIISYHHDSTYNPLDWL